MAQIFLNFMRFFRIFLVKILGWYPLLRVGVPS